MPSSNRSSVNSRLPAPSGGRFAFTAAPRSAGRAPMRVLIVDDTQAARYSLRAFVESLGHEVAGEAADGLEAVELVGALRPDLVLMDFMMPRLDGLAATASITRDHAGMRVLAYTSVVDEDTRELFRRAGALGLVGKGDLPGLTSALERCARSVDRARTPGA